MKRIDLLAVVLLFTTAGASAAATREIAFARGSQILVAELDGSHPRQMAKGAFPNISPDGTRIVFNTEGEKRRISVVDVATKKVKIFQAEIPSDNCFGALWSPDGGRILFNIWSDNKWHLASIAADGSGFRYLRRPATRSGRPAGRRTGNRSTAKTWNGFIGSRSRERKRPAGKSPSSSPKWAQ